MDSRRRSRIVRISKEHPYYRTSNKGNIAEPRLIMAERLGRNLTSGEIVYVKDGNYDNTSADNLIILTRRESSIISGWKRLKERRLRLDSEIAIAERLITESRIDIATLDRCEDDGRYGEVDRDRETYERSRRGRSTHTED